LEKRASPVGPVERKLSRAEACSLISTLQNGRGFALITVFAEYLFDYKLTSTSNHG
jgi:hypothetical protein